MTLLSRSIPSLFTATSVFNSPTSELLTAAYLRERSSRVAPLERAADATRRTLTALDGLKEPVEDLRLAARALRAEPTVAYGVSSSDTAVASGVATEGATEGTYALSVSSVARRSSYSFTGAEVPFTSPETTVVAKIDDSLPEKARSVTFTFGTDTTQEVVAVELTNSTTIENFVEKFNEASDRATAELVELGTTATPLYSVVIRSNDVGTTTGFLSVEVGEGLQDPNGDGDSSDSPFMNAISEQADNARFTIGGIAGTFERESNTVTDAIGGVSVFLTGSGDTALTVSADSSGLTSRVRTVVKALNALVDFIGSRNGFARERASLGGGIAPGALRSTTVDELLREGLRGDLRGLSTVASGALSLAELGVTTTRGGRLEFDETRFRSQVLQMPKEAAASLTVLGSRIESTVDTFGGSAGLIEVARTRVASERDRYESSIAAIERRLEERSMGLAERYSRMEGTIARLSSQSAALSALFPPRERP